MNAKRSEPPAPCAFTAPYLALFGIMKGRQLAAAGEILYATAEAADQAPETYGDALGEVVSLAQRSAEELETLGEFLGIAENLQRVRAHEAGLAEDLLARGEDRAAYLHALGAEVGADLRRWAKVLRDGLDASPELVAAWIARRQAPAGPVASYQENLAQLAASLRTWMGRLRQGATALEQILPADPAERDAIRESNREDLPFILWDGVEHLTFIIAGLQRSLELTRLCSAEVTHPRQLG